MSGYRVSGSISRHGSSQMVSFTKYCLLFAISTTIAISTMFLVNGIALFQSAVFIHSALHIDYVVGYAMLALQPDTTDTHMKIISATAIKSRSYGETISEANQPSASFVSLPVCKSSSSSTEFDVLRHIWQKKCLVNAVVKRRLLQNRHTTTDLV